MKCKSILATAALALVFGTLAVADDMPKTPDKMPEMKLPAGWTPDDMKACMEAATPGKMHEVLAQGVGTWAGKNTCWMGPEAEPAKSESTSVITPILDGHFYKCEMTGEMPGMGTYNGLGIYGYDNVSQKFTCTWLDNHSTGANNGIGELSADGKVLTWNFTFNCPITKKPAIMRQVETITSATSRTIEMYAPDPKTGKEYKMMVIELTKK